METGVVWLATASVVVVVIASTNSVVAVAGSTATVQRHLQVFNVASKLGNLVGSNAALDKLRRGTSAIDLHRRQPAQEVVRPKLQGRQVAFNL